MEKNARDVKQEFTEFWAGYPLKVGKIAAEKAYYAARKKHRATAQDLLTGLAQYIVHKPEWQHWAHPKTWLNQGCWMNDYSKPAPSTPPQKVQLPAYRPYVPLAERLRLERDGN